MNRYEREQKAKRHYEYIKECYNDITIDNIECSEIFENTKFGECIYDNINMSIEVLDMTTEAAVNYLKDGACVLNFASFTRPGGGFIKGSIAQEEALCHVSNLYNVLMQFGNAYNNNYNNKSRMNNSMYMDWAIYSPNIPFIYNEEKNSEYFVSANVITCACPNYKAFSENRAHHNLTDDIFNNALYKRIKYILDIANYKSQKKLILGAFGCGVFGNDPERVATIFKELLESKHYNFEKVVFAIPNGNNDNYKKFCKVFNK